MNLLVTMLIQYVILLSIPLFCALIVWLCQHFVRSLPAQQRDALEQFARIAVQQVEQQNAGLSGAAKKQLAMSLMVKLFSTFKIPLPPEEIMSAAIEAAVFFINQLPATVGAQQTHKE